MNKEIGIIGEYHDSVTLSSIALAIEHSNKVLGVNTSIKWINTESLENDDYAEKLNRLDGIWSPPGSPFKSLTGALNAIKYARENKVPFLATCAGYQNTILEYVRNVLGYKKAQNEEYSGKALDLFIHRLACSLAGKNEKVTILENTKASKIYRTNEITGSYFCNFGLNDDYRSTVIQGDLIVSGAGVNDAAHILELKNHPFFIATAFVPQVNSTMEKPDALITEFIKRVNKLD